ncbi:unnamed protein product [Protopolystoma xenopodis]|uniref:Uncharacterized protein n=1 Tax=Protopolystoma xenopodis TaxID=117903 RepID=A0A3S4ZPD5_9PLAT|nr:unnamed protein product [Protopolystoma xenopodis]
MPVDVLCRISDLRLASNGLVGTIKRANERNQPIWPVLLASPTSKLPSTKGLVTLAAFSPRASVTSPSK